MAKRGGMFPGMGAGMNPQQMMLKVQKMQQDMAKAQEEIKEARLTGTAGGGIVQVTLSGDKEMVSLELKPEVVDPEDVEMLQDLILAAYADALRQAEELTEAKMGRFTGGMNLPGLF